MWKLLLLTAGVLVTVISFAATVRLTAEGRLGPLDTIKYMVLAMPPMMQYALPFAAGFGATLAYHRMAQDRELTAAAGGGISHTLLLVPALASGIVLAGIIGELNGRVIPRFLREMEDLVVQDATRLVYNTLSAGRPLEVRNMQVHADKVYRMGADPERGVSERLLLTRVFAVEIDKDGAPKAEATAAQAWLDFVPVPDEGGGRGMTNVILELRDASAYDRDSGNSVQKTAKVSMPVPGVFDDNPKYLSNAELAALPADPDRLNVIDSRRRDLAVHLAARQSVAAIDRSLRERGDAALTDEPGRTLVIRAAGIRYDGGTRRWELIPPRGRRIELELSGGAGEGAKRFSPRTAGLVADLGRDRAERDLKFKLELEEDAVGGRKSIFWSNLTPAVNPLPSLLKMTSAQLLAEAQTRLARDPGDASVRDASTELRARIERLGREIVSKRHERAASAVACLVMVLCGAVTAMRLSGSLPLTVYLWSFFPALFTVITIAAGQQMTHQLGMGGLTVLWGGVAALAAYAGAAFLVVRKH
jgi:lipopolysaccharide export LptBFGC system permease protein LptF